MSWIQTYTGIKFDVTRLTVETIDMRDIAHALSNLCRFTGHTKRFYSVAQHSCLVSARVESQMGLGDVDFEDAAMIAAQKQMRLWALLHDAPEAYLNDIASPVKYLPGLFEEYNRLETGIMDVICEKYGLPTEMPEAVKLADARMLATEKRDLLLVHRDWGAMVEPYNFNIHAEEPPVAREHFLNTFKKLRA